MEPPTPAEVEEVEEVLPLGWKEYRTPEGKVYYYNEKSQISSWMKPKASAKRRKVGSRSWREERVLSMCMYVHMHHMCSHTYIQYVSVLYIQYVSVLYIQYVSVLERSEGHTVSVLILVQSTLARNFQFTE